MSNTILLLEDEPFIALDLEGILNDNGHPDHVTFATCAEAEEWLKECKPSIAIVDPRLSDGVCSAVVRRLTELEVPFIVYSGEADFPHEGEAAFANGDPLPKPALPDQIVAAVDRALGNRR